METISDFWFNNPDLWFNCTPEQDKFISDKYKHLLDTITEPINILNYSKDYVIGYIILTDQFSRHIYRNNKQMIDKFSKFALNASLQLYDTMDNIYTKPEERYFILMPLRHTFDKLYMDMVISKMKNYENDNKLYNRFMKATLYSYSKVICENIQPINSKVSMNEDISNILDVNSLKNFILPRHTLIPRSNHINKAFTTTLKNIDSDTIVISLSGGVDSMISSYILKQSKKNVIAIMINYNNRATSDTEVDFVTLWCNYLKIPLYVRTITSLQRQRNYNRNLYEDVTKRFRFDMYKKLGYPVVLGHNRDDCIENIFANIRKQRSHNNLKGMDYICTNDGCLLVRPLFNTSKSDILEFAKEFNIPYLEDSTPKWSDRGKMRDELIPFLNKFDPSIINGLIVLSESRNDNMHKSIVKKFIDKVDIQYNVKLEDDEKMYGFLFWKDVIIEICCLMNRSYPSHKAIESFVNRLEHNNNGDIPLSKKMNVVFENDMLSFY